MADSIWVVNKETVREKLRWCFAIGLSASVIYGAVIGIPKIYHNNTLNSNAAKIQEVIDKKEYESASTLIKSFSKESLIKTEDKLFLKHKIEEGITEEKALADREKKKQSYMERFEQALESYSIDEALGVVSEFRQTGLIGDKTRNDLESRVHGMTPDGMYKRFLSSTGSRKTTIACEYLERYPEEGNRKEVIKELLVYNASIHMDHLRISQNFGQTYEHLRDFNDLLQEYKADNVCLTEDIPCDEIISESGQYLKQMSELSSINDIQKGSAVKILFVPRSETEYKEEYLKERNMTIPIGSLGVVVDITDVIFVRFDDIKEYEWVEEWKSLPRYWEENGEKNVAEYRHNELKLVSAINAIQKKGFENETSKLEKNLLHYK